MTTRAPDRGDPARPRIELLTPCDADWPLIDRWLHAEHVLEFWHDPEGNARFLRELPHGAQCRVIVVDRTKVGVVVWAHPCRDELDSAGLHEIPDSVVDVDIMIGERRYLGRGIGPTVLETVARCALSDPRVPCVIAASRIDNVASIHAAHKAGFVWVREFDDPVYGRCVLMMLARRLEPSG